MDLTSRSRGGGIPTPPRTGLLVGAAAAVIIVIVLVLGGVGSADHEPPPPLTAEAVEAYLRIAPAVRSDRAAARRAGEPASTWHHRPAFREALDSVEWDLGDYLRVEGQVSAARLRLERPDVFAAEFQESDAPESAVRLVEPRLEEVRVVQGRSETHVR